MSARDPMIHIRVPQSLKDWAAAEATSNRRTLNAQIVFGLEQHMLQVTAGQSGEAAAGEPAKT